MKSKKMLLMFALPFSFTSAFARVQMIPRPEMDLKSMEKNESQFVLKNAKGTLLEKSWMSLAPANWFNLSPMNGAEGVRTEETYVAFGNPQGEDIIVAVVDSGVDVNHEDLQGKMWINSDEIPNNEIDDDHNGYVDDVFGWNFIGGAEGMAKFEMDAGLANGLKLIKGNPSAQVGADTLEVTREYLRMKKLKISVEEAGEVLSRSQSFYFEKLAKIVNENVANATKVVESYTKRLEIYTKAEKVLKAAGMNEITLESVRSLETADPDVLKAKNEMLTLLSNGIDLNRINRVLNYYGDQLKYSYNDNFNPRSIVGDNASDQTEAHYGNNDVTGPDAHHGTHVSGIIAANRENAIGIKGVASKVKIMAVRVVPNGDERDKDVAYGIRYAVDNGAKIINMSFGKAFSPSKKVVDEAMKYAQSKGVLLVHAAGNSNQNNDIESHFPNRIEKGTGDEFTNWLEIGASSFSKDVNLAADFSNYGKNSVDLFAPGVDILSTTPNNKYDTYSGTSMATPVAAAVAAMALAYDSTLDPSSLRSLMLDTSRRYPKLMVNLPGTETQVLFSSLSKTGTIVDSFEMVKALK